MRTIDLRSDTVTLPTTEMLQAMASAPLGDDVYGEDPTVNRLQDVAAERMGKEAALFVSSGTLGNLLGLLVNARSGQEVIADASSHVFMSEAAGAAAVGGIQIRQVITERGVMSPEQTAAVIRPPHDTHQPTTAAIVVENTHNRHGGIAWPLQDLRRLSDIAHDHGVLVHMDGARVFNAAVALKTSVRDIAATSDTITFCLSKGLSCPAGSLLCGSTASIEAAKRWRKMLGGGMRQAGVLAAAGLIAMETMVDRLVEDHENARMLAIGLAEMPGALCDLTLVETNIVFMKLLRLPAVQFLDECRAFGLLGGSASRDEVRFVTHRGITGSHVQEALAVCHKVLCAEVSRH
jgi:threonine aldolase